jgi:hypothetical protein
MSLQNHNISARIIIRLIGIAFVISCSVLILFFRQYIYDQIVVWQFKPSAEMVELTSRIDLSENGKFVFFASQPELDTPEDFNQSCSRVEATTSILGCYSGSRIYIYNVSDIKLDGIREVTAAHEMLHAVYQRMSETEKTTVDALLEAEYAKLSGDQSFSDLMDYYARAEPSERSNELHSVIGTVVPKISPELETHYAEYFSSRQTVVNYYEKYNGVFQALTDRAKVLVGQLQTLSTSIPEESTQYNSDVLELNSDINSFNAKASNGDFDSNSQFYAERTLLIKRVNLLNQTRASIDSDIDNYNLLLDEYNSIASESKQLYNSMDSSLVTAPSV